MLHILAILDRSGSMQGRCADHEGGLRAFVEQQRSAPGDARFTLIQFDTENPCEIVYDAVPFDQVGAIRLTPRGGTPLLDAVGRALAHIERHQPEELICIVITDGYENASTEWTKERIKQRIGDLEKRGGTFLFLGANIDAFAEAGSVGIAGATTMNFSHAHDGAVQAAYLATTQNMQNYRTMRSCGARMAAASGSLYYSAEQRSAAMGGGSTTDQPQPGNYGGSGSGSAQDLTDYYTAVGGSIQQVMDTIKAQQAARASQSPDKE